MAAARFESGQLATLLELQFGGDLDDELKLLLRAPPGIVPLDVASSGLPTGRKRQILVGEDDVDQAAMIENILIAEGFEVVLTRNGADLLNQAHRTPPDLILLDGHMPILNGFHAAERLYADPEPPLSPFSSFRAPQTSCLASEA